MCFISNELVFFPDIQTQNYLLFMTLKPWNAIIFFDRSIKKNRLTFTITLFALLLAASCTPHKKIVYLQRQAEDADTLEFKKPDYIVKSGDILYIQVLTLDEKSYAMFNSDRSNQRSTAAGGGGIGNIQMFLSGYNVDEKGQVKMPVVGSLDVGGKTVEQVTKYIEKEVEEYLIGATVLVKLVNFSITVLGEVGSPGKYYIYDNRVNVIDALAVAGDLTDFGNRNITIVRQTDEGAAFGSINLNDAHMMTSEFFYLQPNDILYVEPYKIKRFGFNQFPFALIFSTISTTLLLINFFGN